MYVCVYSAVCTVIRMCMYVWWFLASAKVAHIDE